MWIAGVVTVVGVVFAVVIAHVALTQGQFRLAQLQAEADGSQAGYARLRLQVAELESPQRIVAAAQQHLGMVSPASVTYLAPKTSSDLVPIAATRPSSPEETDSGATSWSAVKPHLTGG